MAAGWLELAMMAVPYTLCVLFPILDMSGVLLLVRSIKMTGKFKVGDSVYYKILGQSHARKRKVVQTFLCHDGEYSWMEYKLGAGCESTHYKEDSLEFWVEPELLSDAIRYEHLYNYEKDISKKLYITISELNGEIFALKSEIENIKYKLRGIVENSDAY